MGEEKKIVKIEALERIDPSRQVVTNPIDPTGEIAVSKTKFDAATERADQAWAEKTQRTQSTTVATLDAPDRPSPIDELRMSSRKIQQLEPATTDKIVDQAQTIQNKMQAPIEKIDTTLKTNPDVKISPVHEASMSERLVHIDSSLKSAMGIAGVEVKGVPPPTTPQTTPQQQPLVQFLAYLTHGDRQLNSVITEIQALNGPGAGNLTPAKLLAVQIKLNFVQQELEFFSNVLNKALESTKTIMNVQV